ncbi:DUF4153 domain-containing protein [Pontibacter sp. SGAir0037]|uniref:DUF4153 domain-containing protein n=1 Tax=Pontibacter sp. SGAir0037 TaxID=2571030 RepID=UPI0010CD3CC9|nr:DUF4153 domain-containing protein [Pontibacter sp. SGAir0037]QCR24632.1 hypothetical protein C1N53_21250 [Pontibacter sp. SGAir0037]
MAFRKLISLQQLYRGAVDTFLTYPFALLSAIGGTAAAIWRAEISYDKLHLYPYLDKLMLLGALGLVLFFVIELVVQRYKFGGAKRWLFLFLGILFLAVYYGLLPKQVEGPQWLRFLMLSLVLHLAASYVMFLNSKEENAFWQFNKALFLRLLTTVLYSAVLYIGVAIAVLALEKLFSVDVSQNFYFQLWLFMVGVFNTWFFLAGVPTNVQELEQEHQYPKGLKVFTQFVLLPLVSLYLVILYLYFGKIIIQWQWPNGWVSVLVLCFSVAGILSLLLIHPVRQHEGNTWMRTFIKWFYRALFPLIILLLLAIWRRVSEYGITEPRYVVLVLALWLFCTALYFLFSKQKNIKFIPVTLSIVILTGAFGPAVNAFHISEWSQVKRLEYLLKQNNLLVGDHVSSISNNKPKAKTEAEISAIVRYLVEMHDPRVLQPWFRQDLDSLLTAQADTMSWSRWARQEAQAKELVAMMGLNYRNQYEGYAESVISYHSFKLDKEASYKVQGYDYFIPAFLLSSNVQTEYRHKSFSLGGNPFMGELEPDKGALEFRYYDDTLVLNLQPYLQQTNESGVENLPEAEMTHYLQGKRVEVKVLLQNIWINYSEKGKELMQVECAVFVKQKE